jgi:hypothetical protein
MARGQNPSNFEWRDNMYIIEATAAYHYLDLNSVDVFFFYVKT